MKRTMLLALLFAVMGCPGDKKVVKRDTTPLDTMPADLSGVKSNIPAAAPDTFRAKAPPAQVAGRTIPSAPQALMDAVTRSQTVTKFCYQEKGQKADPSLRGNVAMIVTVGGGAVTGAKVGDSNWSSSSGRAVNQCLNERASQAWKLVPGSVPNGTYSVQLSFTG
jgi:hypothetical protein